MVDHSGRRARVGRLGRVGVVTVLVGGLLPLFAAAPAGAALIPPYPACDPSSQPLPPIPNPPVPLDPLVFTNAVAGAPAHNEFGFPLAEAPTFEPKGYMLVVHGGGWFEHGPRKVQEMRYEANMWRNRGWATLNITHRPCSQSIADVFWFYQYLRSAAGPDAVLCATGASAGGHLVMMLAGIFPDLDCAIAQGGPMDLLSIPGQTASTTTWTNGPQRVYELATSAFGPPPGLLYSSPHAWVGNIGVTRMLLATAMNDPLIPLAQAQNYRTAVLAANPGQYVQVMELPLGTAEYFPHGGTTVAGEDAYRIAEDALVAPLV
jgi:dienelactone hydrolase